MFRHIFVYTTVVWKSGKILLRVVDISLPPTLKLRDKIQKFLLIKIQIFNFYRGCDSLCMISMSVHEFNQRL